jgi:glycosyltransferase involved in cell wall biosynthesis
MEHILREGRFDLPKLHVYGPLPWHIDGGVYERAIGDHVVFRGRVSYPESRRVMKEAKALLLLLPHKDEFTTWVPSKLYSYLFSPAPILVLAPEGDATRVVRDTGRGVVISSADPATIAKEIVTFLQALRRGDLQLRLNHDKIREYSWAYLSDRLEGILRAQIHQ